MRRAVILAAICLLALVSIAASCSGNDGADGVPLDSGIQGLVTIGPVCPVEQANSPCPDKTYAATIVVEDLDDNEVARAQSGEDGRFRVNLWPGRYTIVPHSPNEGAPPQAPEQQVEVRVGEYTQVAIQYDSGIR
jgi:hypothetical protein